MRDPCPASLPRPTVLWPLLGCKQLGKAPGLSHPGLWVSPAGGVPRATSARAAGLASPPWSSATAQPALCPPNLGVLITATLTAWRQGSAREVTSQHGRTRACTVPTCHASISLRNLFAHSEPDTPECIPLRQFEVRTCHMARRAFGVEGVCLLIRGSWADSTSLAQGGRRSS